MDTQCGSSIAGHFCLDADWYDNINYMLTLTANAEEIQRTTRKQTKKKKVAQNYHVKVLAVSRNLSLVFVLVSFSFILLPAHVCCCLFVIFCKDTLFLSFI